jgi:GrpB-like predicted nucleotidyltransferase (UPF0157 family)
VREPGAIEIVDYNPAWPERYEAVRARIATGFAPMTARIEHIGSTAVPGLAGKPIVDVLVELADPAQEWAYRTALEAAGFELRVREPRHRMYRTAARDVHVHIWLLGSADAADCLLLRDRLRASVDDRRLYERVKRELAAREWGDMNEYAEAKGPVIAAIMSGPGTSSSAQARQARRTAPRR